MTLSQNQPPPRANTTNTYNNNPKVIICFSGPTAASLFSRKVNANSIHRPGARWTNSNFVGQLYSSLYLRPEILTVAEKGQKKALEHGINGHEAALRGCLHHRALKAELSDGLVIAASSLDQWKENLKACDQDSLQKDLVDLFEGWKTAEPVAPFAYIDGPFPGVGEGLTQMKNE